MKTTGVVRRIDDLGRIVIPKEIRRTLRIRDGESLEIFVDKEMVALKKYSPMEDLEDVAKSFVDITFQSIQTDIFVSDRDTIIAIAGGLKKKYIGKSISTFLEKVLVERENIIEHNIQEIELSDGMSERASYALVPILVNGDSIGVVGILSSERNINEYEEKIAQIVSQFLGKHIEE